MREGVRLQLDDAGEGWIPELRGAPLCGAIEADLGAALEIAHVAGASVGEPRTHERGVRQRPDRDAADQRETHGPGRGGDDLLASGAHGGIQANSTIRR